MFCNHLDTKMEEKWLFYTYRNLYLKNPTQIPVDWQSVKMVLVKINSLWSKDFEL